TKGGDAGKGSAGTFLAGESGGHLIDSSSQVAGGGGGGAGRIVIRSDAATRVLTGTISPDLATTATSTEALRTHPLP
ncbi:MAG: hypothetical protein KAI47_25540, partial [Deltaproteobacteria bacterium]|nr:hypothetical protein [Deltaproteobacteria bacterium]